MSTTTLTLEVVPYIPFGRFNLKAARYIRHARTARSKSEDRLKFYFKMIDIVDGLKSKTYIMKYILAALKTILYTKILTEYNKIANAEYILESLNYETIS